jgi:hypothetical protein
MARGVVARCAAGVAVVACVVFAIAPASAADPRDYATYLEPPDARMLQFQAEWWALLQHDTGNDPQRVAAMLVSNKPLFFYPSCSKAPVAGDFERLQQAYATLMLSGTPQAATPATSVDRGRFLACLARSGMATQKAHIETQWLRALKDKAIPEIPVKCEWRPDERALMAEVYPHSARMNWYMTSQLAPGNLSRWPQSPATSTSATTFNNVLLHEMVHYSGSNSEEMAYTTVACCGEEVPDRAAACAALDRIVARDTALYELAHTLHRADDFAGLEGFTQSDRSVLAHHVYDVLAMRMPDLVTPAQRAACIQRAGRAACIQQATTAVYAALDRTFGADCTSIVAGGSAASCANVPPALRKTMATTMLTQLFPAP